MKSITVEKLLGNNKNYQQVTGNEESLKRVILTGEINRPGFELAGFFKHSDFRRIIVFGDKEMAFIAEMTEERQKEIFPCLINEEVPCIRTSLFWIPVLKLLPYFSSLGETYSIFIGTDW